MYKDKGIPLKQFIQYLGSPRGRSGRQALGRRPRRARLLPGKAASAARSVETSCLVRGLGPQA